MDGASGAYMKDRLILDLQRALRAMRTQGVETVAMEVFMPCPPEWHHAGRRDRDRRR